MQDIDLETFDEVKLTESVVTSLFQLLPNEQRLGLNRYLPSPSFNKKQTSSKIPFF